MNPAQASKEIDALCEEHREGASPGAARIGIDEDELTALSLDRGESIADSCAQASGGLRLRTFAHTLAATAFKVGFLAGAYWKENQDG